MPIAGIVMVLLAQDPESIVNEDGLAVMEKSDTMLGTVSVSLMVWTKEPEVPVMVSV